jgi:alkylation response protein AidB-like acyl-CoA dehydrogenase
MTTLIDYYVEPLAAARALAPDLNARAAEGAALGTMPPDLVETIEAAGLFRLALPRVLGGLELDPAAIVEIIEEVSRADGSAGWSVLIGNSTCFFAWLNPLVAASLIGNSGDFVAASVFAPKGRGVPDRAGRFVIDGRWPFNSGCAHADWFANGFLVMDGETPRILSDGRPDWRFAFFPRQGVEIVETWDALGLQGTGSDDVRVAGVSVPEEHTAAPLYESARHDGPLWRLAFFEILAAFICGWPLGVARRALDEFAVLARSRGRGTSADTIADDPYAQVELGRAEARLRSARAFVFDAIGDAYKSACAGDIPDPDQQALVQLATQQAMRAGVEAVDTAFTLAGGRAVYADQPLQRCFRDIHTGRQHAIFSADRFKAFARSRFDQ